MRMSVCVCVYDTALCERARGVPALIYQAANVDTLSSVARLHLVPSRSLSQP